ncbi:MAG: GNAT family N-acetyltransferase [Rickettsiales bacterium]|jgi:putative hemolysin|nr:GNAT family N-acetyltransferase [Rickettsiales bacterium]
MVAFNNDKINPIIVNNYEIRLAENSAEVLACQKLRYEHMIKEYAPDAGDNNDGVNPTNSDDARAGIDRDKFDDYCAHLIVINHELGDNPDDNIIATYRFMRAEHKNKIGRWYSDGEFDLSKLKPIENQLLELGRATVHTNFRNNITMKLLWQGIANYAQKYDIKYMIGTASFHSTDINELKEAMSFVYHYCAMPDEFDCPAITDDARDMNLMPKDEIDPKKTLLNLPPVIKGYLRVGGCSFGKSAFVDFPFGCIDIFTFFEFEKASEKYMNHFMGDVGNSDT